MSETIESKTLSDKLPLILEPDSRVELYPLAVRVEDDQYIVGRMATGEFVALPEIGGRIIQLLQRGCTLGETQTFLDEEYDVEVDITAFVMSLIELGFVQALDGRSLGTDDTAGPNLVWLQPHHVRWLFSWPIRILYSVLLMLAAFVLVTHTELAPRYQDFFWSASTSIVIVGNTIMFVFSAALHELAHLVAARSLGVPARINLSTRLHNLVVQTDVTGLWSIPRNRRYRVYLAGMLSDLILMSVAVLLLAYMPLPVLAQNLLRSLILLLFFSIAGQFHFYMRTDVYFVALDLSRCYNMFEDALSYLRYRVRRLWFRIFQAESPEFFNPLDRLPAREQRIVGLYAWLVLFGSTVSLTVFAVYGLPIMIELFVQASVAVWQGATLGQPRLFLDGLVTLLVEGSIQGLFVVTFVKNRKHWFLRLRHRLLPRSATSC
jgi:putative peptide zinc metalloprotease protein